MAIQGGIHERGLSLSIEYMWGNMQHQRALDQ